MPEQKHQAYQAAGPLLHNRHEPLIDALMEEGKKYFPVEFSTEAILTVGRTALFIEKDGADMIINASPFTCMPGVITGGIFRQMSSRTGIPIVNMYYDGTMGLNEKIVTFLHNLKGRGGRNKSGRKPLSL